MGHFIGGYGALSNEVRDYFKSLLVKADYIQAPFFVGIFDVVGYMSPHLCYEYSMYGFVDGEDDKELSKKYHARFHHLMEQVRSNRVVAGCSKISDSKAWCIVRDNIQAGNLTYVIVESAVDRDISVLAGLIQDSLSILDNALLPAWNKALSARMEGASMEEYTVV